MMHRNTFLLPLVFLVLGGARTAGEEWVVIGPRAMGMGGAGVAVTRGPLATYWNPANLAARPVRAFTAGVSLPVSASLAARGDVIRSLDRLYGHVKDLDWTGTIESVFDNPAQRFDDPAHEDDLKTLLRVVTEDLPALNAPGKGVTAAASGEVGLQLGRLAIAARALSWSAVHPVADLSATRLALGNGFDDVFGAVNTPADTDLAARLIAANPGVAPGHIESLVYWTEQAGVDTSGGAVESMLDTVIKGTTAGGLTLDNCIASNESGFMARGLGVGELGLTYAHPLHSGRLALGATVKAMHGVTYERHYTLNALESGGDVVKHIKDRRNRRDSLRLGIDAGVTVVPFDFLALGIAARQLNRPVFAASGKDYKLAPQVRCGAALYPASWLTLACDVDLTRNRSEALPGYTSQTVAGGIEIAVLDALFLRGGISKNIALSEGLAYHAGLGLHGGPFRLELAGAVSDARVRIKHGNRNATLPERAGLSVMIEVLIDL